MLLRESSHRPVDGGHEIAASPDTPGREAWRWHVRLVPGADDQPVETDTAEGVEASVDTVIVGTGQQVDRERHELLLLHVATGAVSVDGRQVLTRGDVLVSEGDDPLVTLAREGAEGAVVSRVRLRHESGAPLNWVP